MRWSRTEIETIVGARRDRAFGPIVMFGLGGIYVEVMRDIAFRAFPLGHTRNPEDDQPDPLLSAASGCQRRKA